MRAVVLDSVDAFSMSYESQTVLVSERFSNQVRRSRGTLQANDVIGDPGMNCEIAKKLNHMQLLFSPHLPVM